MADVEVPPEIVARLRTACRALPETYEEPAWARCEDDLMSAMDEYLDGLPPEQRAALARVRAIVDELEPEAEEGESYGMPAFLYAGRPLLGFRAAKKHLSVFPFSPAAVEAVEDRLEGFDVSKGTIRFSPDSPLPENVLADLVRARKKEITAKQ